MLFAVVALALTGGPLPGLLTGFLAGLALDVAPPASHAIGQYALVFCVVGYACGRLAGLGDTRRPCTWPSRPRPPPSARPCTPRSA